MSFWSYEPKTAYNKRKADAFRSEAQLALFNSVARRELRSRGYSPDQFNFPSTMFDTEAVQQPTKQGSRSAFSVVAGAVGKAAGAVGGAVEDVLAPGVTQLARVRFTTNTGKFSPQILSTAEVKEQGLQKFGGQASRALDTATYSPMNIPGVAEQVNKLPGPLGAVGRTAVGSVNLLTLASLGIAPTGAVAKSIVGASLGAGTGSYLGGSTGETVGAVAGGVLGFGRTSAGRGVFHKVREVNPLTPKLPESATMVRQAIRNWEEDIGVGRSLGRLEVDKLRAVTHNIQLDENGLVQNIKPRVKDASRNWMDVFSNPSQYVWPSREAKAVANRYYKPVAKRLQELADAGIVPKELVADERYIHRVVVSIDDEAVSVGPRGGIGAKQSYQMPRIRDAAGEQTRINYNNDIAGNLQIFLEETDKTLADMAFAQALKGYKTTTSTRVAETVKTAVADARTDLRTAKENLRRAGGVVPEPLSSDTSRRLSKDVLQGQYMDSIKRGGYGPEIESQRAAFESAFKRKFGLSPRQASPEVSKNLDESKVMEWVSSHPTGRASGPAAQLDAFYSAQKNFNQSMGNRREAIQMAKIPRSGKEGFLPEPFAAGGIYPAGVIKEVERGVHPPRGLLTDTLRAAGYVNQIFKPLWASVDLSYSALQTAPSFASNPAGWLRMQRVVLTSLLNPKNYHEYMSNPLNARAAKEMIKIGKVPLYGNELTIGAAQRGPLGGAITKAIMAGEGTPLRATNPLALLKTGNDAWDRALNVMSIENWKMGRAILMETDGAFLAKLTTKAFGGTGYGTAKSSLEGLGTAIAHGTGRLTLAETAAQGPVQKLLMNALPFAGNYWTGWAKLIGDATVQGGMQANTARRLVAGWAALGVGTYSLLAYLNGEEPHLDPQDTSNFLTIKVGGVKVGMGGPLQQALILGSRVSSNPEDAPGIMTRFARGKSSPVVSIFVDLVGRETYMGKPLDSPDRMVSYLMSKIVPFALQDPLAEGLQGNTVEAQASLKASVPSSLGLRAFPVNRRDTLAQERFNLSWKELEPAQQAEIKAAHPDIITQTGPYAERAQIGQRFSEMQGALDASYPPGPAWREAYQELMQRKSGEYTQWEEAHPAEAAKVVAPKNDNDLALNQYYKAFDESQTPWGQLDPEALEMRMGQLESQWTDEQKSYINRNTGLTSSPVVKQYKQAQKTLKPYWEIADQVWQGFQESHAEYRQFPNLDSYLQDLAATLRKQGISEEAINSKISDAPISKRVGTAVSRLRDQYRRQHPTVDQLLTEWYGYQPISVSSKSQSTKGQLAGPLAGSLAGKLTD